MALFLSGWSGGKGDGVIASDYSDELQRVRARIANEVEEGSFDLATARAWMERFAREVQANLSIPPVAVRDETIAAAGKTIPIRFYGPDTARTTIVFVHGGGWILGSIASHDNIPRWLADETGGQVISVGYSLAPEAPFPQAVNECRDVLRAVLGRSSSRDRRVFVMGDSAGANLSAMSILRLSADERARIDGFVSLYGAYSPELNLSSHHLYGDGRYGMSGAQMRWFWALYAPQLRVGDREELSPLSQDLSSFPPTLCVGTECDLLLDDTLALYSQLTSARVDVRLALWPALPHGCMHFIGSVESVNVAASSILNFIDMRCEVEGHGEIRRAASPVQDKAVPAEQPAASAAADALPTPEGKAFELVYLTSRSRLHGSVAHRLANRIISGEYPPGHVLPNEEVASASFGVSRTAYREAARTLVAKGLLTAKPKVGTSISPKSDWQLLDADVLNWHLESKPDAQLVKDLFEFRLTLEPGAAALAAVRRTESDTSRLADCLSRMAKSGPRSGTWLQAAIMFHQTILQATHNDAFLALTSVVTSTLTWSSKLLMTANAPPPPRDPVGDHARVFERIASEDAEGARTAMRELVRASFDAALSVSSDHIH